MVNGSRDGSLAPGAFGAQGASGMKDFFVVAMLLIQRLPDQVSH